MLGEGGTLKALTFWEKAARWMHEEMDPIAAFWEERRHHVTATKEPRQPGAGAETIVHVGRSIARSRGKGLNECRRIRHAQAGDVVPTYLRVKVDWVVALNARNVDVAEWRNCDRRCGAIRTK